MKKGSITVEAAFVFSLILLVILWILKTAIGLYQETLDTVLIDKMNIEGLADSFRRLFFVKELLP